MFETTHLAVYGSLLVAGLAGSLHCIGMCGPILLSFSQVFDAAARRGGRGTASRGDFVWYHAGRIWTYGVLGFVAAWGGRGLREASAYLGWQRPASVLVGALVILSGVLLLGLLPGLRLDGILNGCGLSTIRGVGWLRALLDGPGRISRLLLGATMGLLPCGLVYAMLAVVATLPGPLHGALGMVVFGLGTLPSLSAVLLAGHALPARLRLHGTRIAGVALILVGCWMTARTLLVDPAAGCPAHPGAPAGHNVVHDGRESGADPE